MSFFAGILSFILVINCLLLILLVLIQLPKKDAGAGLAFGGGAADALFGAGSGNVLTKITKYATIVFLVMAIILGVMENHLHNQGGASDFEKQVQAAQQSSTATFRPATTPPPATKPATTSTTSATNSLPLLLTPGTLSNAPAAPAKTK